MNFIKRYFIVPLSYSFGGIALAAVFVCGKYSQNGLPILLFTDRVWLKILCLGVFMTGALIVFFRLMKEKWQSGGFLSNKIKGFMERPNFCRLCMAVLFISWIPALLASFPGSLGYDFGGQYWEGVLTDQWSNHHPILHTFMISVLVKFSYLISSDYVMGIFIFSLLQMLLLSLAFSKMITLLRDNQLNNIIVLMTLAIFALNPANAMMSVNMTKDVLFTAFVVMWVVDLYKMVYSPIVFFAKKLNAIMFITGSFFMCAFRNNGIYVFAAGAIGMFIAAKGFRKQVATLVFITSFLWFIYTVPFFHLMGITRTESAEALSIPIQQLSRAAIYQKDRISEKDQQMIEEYLPNYTAYAPKTADPVKSFFNNELFGKHFFNFFILWAKIGLKCPSAYADAFLINTTGFWYPLNDTTNTSWDYIYYDYPKPGHEAADPKIYKGRYPAQLTYRKSLLPVADRFYTILSQTTASQKWGTMIFMNPGFCLFFLILIGLASIFYRNRRFQYIVVPMAVLYLTIIMGPVAWFRYAYPLMCVLPMGMLVAGNGAYHD